MSKLIENYYNFMAEEEERRLFKDYYHRLEYIVTMYYINKHFPKSGRVLDCGCGPGHYAIALARRGYNVALVDISSKLLSIAREKFCRENLEDRILAVVKTSSTNLKVFSDNFFDAALCLGPMYHLITEEEKRRTAKELFRVLKPRGVLIVAAISYFGVLGTILARYPEEILDEKHKEVFEKGIWRASKYYTGKHVFPDAYFWKPLELKEFLEKHGFETVEMAACEGIFTHLREQVNEAGKDIKKWHKIIELVIRTSNDPTIVGHTEHFLWIGKAKK